MPGVRTKILMIGDRYFLCEEERKYRMNLKEQLKKVMDDQEKLERKKDKFLEEYDEKKKKILLKKKELEQKIQKEKNEKILQAVQESFGEINEKNMDAFLDILKKTVKNFPWRWKLLQKIWKSLLASRRNMYRISAQNRRKRTIHICLTAMSHEPKKYHLYDPFYGKGMETSGTKNPRK